MGTDDTRAKLKRARSHLTNLKRQATLIGRDPDRHRILVDYDPDEGRYVVYSKMPPEPLPDLSLVFGDIIHNARGSLDFTTWQLAKKHLQREPTEKQAPSIQFPITSNLVKFNSVPLWSLVSKEARDEMLRHQPHPGSDVRNNHLAVLHWVSNRDKHRLILPFFADITPPLMPEYTFAPPLPADIVRSHSFLMGPSSNIPEVVFYKGDPTTVKLGYIQLTPEVPNTKVYIDPQPPINVLFSSPDGYLSVADIKALIDEVERVIGCFDRFF